MFLFSVGKRIVTKRISEDDSEDDSDMLDLTPEYKSAMEKEKPDKREQFHLRMLPEAEVVEDVLFDLEEIDSIPLGQPFHVVVNSINKSNEKRTVTAALHAETVYYNGKRKDSIKGEQGTFSLKPGQREQLKIYVDPTEYVNKLTDDNQVKIYAMAKVIETKQTWSEEDDFALTKPELNIRVITENPKVRQECVVEFRYKVQCFFFY